MRNAVTLLALIIGACHPAIAQVGYGVEAGVGLSTYKFAPMTSPVDYTAASTSPVFSGKAGGLIDVPLNQHFSFQAGIFLALKGGNRQFSYYQNAGNNEEVNQTLHAYYGEAPLMLLYKTGIQGEGRFIFGIGVVPSYLLFGQDKLIQDTGANAGTPFNAAGASSISVGNTLLGFDIGLGLSAGYELPTGLFFRAYYTDGVSDIGVGTEVDKNRMFGVSAGYLFGKGRNIKKETNDLIDKG